MLLDDNLEGQVTIDPDEYRRLQQEVKMVKTVLLKLRRELQGDQSPSSPLGLIRQVRGVCVYECVVRCVGKTVVTLTRLHKK